MNKDEWLNNFYKIHDGNVIAEITNYMVMDVIKKCKGSQKMASEKLGIGPHAIRTILIKLDMLDEMKELCRQHHCVSACKQYRIIYPDGSFEETTNLSKYERDNGYPTNALRSCAYNTAKTYKGLTVLRMKG